MSHYRGVEKSSVNTQLKKPATKIVIEHCFTKRVLHGASSYSVLIQVSSLKAPLIHQLIHTGEGPEGLKKVKIRFIFPKLLSK